MQNSVIVGDVFGCITVVEVGLNKFASGQNNAAVKCKCECGLETVKITYKLWNHKWRKCSSKCALRKLDVFESDWLVNIGDNFNRWTVIGKPFFKAKKKEGKSSSQYVLCECECSKQKVIRVDNLKGGHSKSCNCHKNDSKRKGSLAVNGLKICSFCLKEKYISEFDTRKDTIDGYRSDCKRCNKNRQLMKRYGISIEEFELMVQKQKGCCACCGELCNKFKVDHDHHTNKVRELLCFKCNSGLGLFNEDVLRLQNAINYLNKHHDDYFTY